MNRYRTIFKDYECELNAPSVGDAAIASVMQQRARRGEPIIERIELLTNGQWVLALSGPLVVMLQPIPKHPTVLRAERSGLIVAVLLCVLSLAAVVAATCVALDHFNLL